MNILQIEHVTKRYAGHTALDDVSLEVPQGSIYGLLGPNGAGKTTLIRVINRITLPDAGTVIFNGHPITDDDIHQMKVGQQAIFFARLKGLSRREAVERLKKWFVRFGIEDWWDKKVEDLSKGMAQKVQFITTVVHEPRLLIFDEPFSGFDPINANLLKREIMRLRDNGATVIFSTHNMSSVEEICDHITLINKSHNILSGSVDEVRRRFGENIFEVTYDGDTALLESVAAPMAELLGTTEVSDTPYHTTRLKLNPTTSVRNIVAAVNDAVNLRSFNEVIPSMNDIFIRAVEGKL